MVHNTFSLIQRDLCDTFKISTSSYYAKISVMRSPPQKQAEGITSAGVCEGQKSEMFENNLVF